MKYFIITQTDSYKLLVSVVYFGKKLFFFLLDVKYLSSLARDEKKIFVRNHHIF